MKVDNLKLEERIQDYYNSVSEYIKEDICEATVWAKKTLTNLEGSGHLFIITGKKDMVVCSFAKPSWSADHCGRPMEDGAQAIVMAVSEYLCGA